jgi:hypothetical protein
MSPAGLSTSAPLEGLATPTGGSLSAIGCGGTVLVCPDSMAQRPATPTAALPDIRQRFDVIEVSPVS